MGILINVVWCAGIALKGAAACRMAWNGLAKRIPPLCIFLVVCVLQSGILVALRPRLATYLKFYSATLPFGLLTECAAVIAVFWVLASNYRNFRVFGSILLSGFAVAGVVAASITCFEAFPHGVNTLWAAALLVQRYASIVIVVVLAGTRLTLPESPRIPIPVNARRAADILVLDAVLGVATAWIARVYGFSHPWVTAWPQIIAGLLLGVLWLMAAKRVEDKPFIQRSPEDLAWEERESALAMHRAAAQVREAARLLHRQ
jgi:hypothetical protein